MKAIKVLTFVFIAIWVSSCEKDSCFQVDLMDSNIYQLEREWIMIGFNDVITKVEECASPEIRQMNIVFSDSGRIEAVSSCNNFHGSYKISNTDSLLIENLFTTLIGCRDLENKWEEKYYRALSNATNFRINRNRLTIETSSEIEVIFKAY